MNTPLGFVAVVVSAGIVVFARRGRAWLTVPARTNVVESAGVVVVARRGVVFGDAASLRVAKRVGAGVGVGADQQLAGLADPGLAGIIGCTRGAIGVTRSSVRLRDDFALAGCRIAGSILACVRHPATTDRLITRLTDSRSACPSAGLLALIGRVAGLAFLASCRILASAALTCFVGARVLVVTIRRGLAQADRLVLAVARLAHVLCTLVSVVAGFWAA